MSFLSSVEAEIAKVKAWFTSLPTWLQSFVSKMATDEGAILDGLVTVAVKDIEAGGLSTASFVAAAKDVFAKLVAQNISTFTLQDVFTALNSAVSAPVAPAVASVVNPPAAN
jgi:hypothetical protein